ncbi:MAG: glycoside hydrolase family protein [Methylococcales bacterium]
MDDLVALMDQLRRHEGLRLHPYRCTAGKLTIGVGRNLDDNGITENEADFLLSNDLNRVATELRQNSPAFDKLDPVRKAVLIDMCFNLGISRLRMFKKMFAAIDEQDWALAAEEMVDSRWCSQVGQRCEILRMMMETGRR